MGQDSSSKLLEEPGLEHFQSSQLEMLGVRVPDVRSGLKPERAKAAQVAPTGLTPPLPPGGFSTETSSAHPSWLAPYLISALIIFWCPGVQSSRPSHSSQALERFCSGIK